MLSMMVDHPLVVFLFSLAVLGLSVQLGGFLRKKSRPLQADEAADLSLVINASLTLLALIIGFSFSMAVNRYDQRKNYEEEEANAIGTEYVRSDFLPAADGTKVRELLTEYLERRLRFYTVRNQRRLEQVDRETAKLQAEMWSIVERDAAAQPSPLAALVVSGMNDVLNRQGYAQAAWWNRIPDGAWTLMLVLAICCSVLVGYGSHRKGFLITVLPLLVSIAFLLISDIDSPRWGVIRVGPRNLISLSQSMHKP